MSVFNEDSLKKAIAEKWGSYGAHMEVFDVILNKARTLDFLVAGKFVSADKVQEAEKIAKTLNPQP